MEFIIHIEEGFAPSMRLTDESLKVYDSVNNGQACDLARKAWNSALLKDAFMFKLYNHSDKEYLCIKADLPVKFIVRPNHNGYTTFLVREDYTHMESVMSLEEYKSWKENHVAEWIDGKWVYVEKKVESL